MNLYPKWLLALAGVNLFSLLLIPFFLFGGIAPFGTSDNGVVRFLFYLLTNALWVAPIAAFFAALRLYDYTHRKTAVAVALVGIALTGYAASLLF